MTPSLQQLKNNLDAADNIVRSLQDTCTSYVSYATHNGACLVVYDAAYDAAYSAYYLARDAYKKEFKRNNQNLGNQ
jgi:hypothetical protein|tara:strand:- start:274 stop:501 length:228 start_codon:yes stop_codon:yes gene_type:complete